MEHSLSPVALQLSRDILKGHTSSPGQILKSLLIIHFSILDVYFFHRLEQFTGQRAKSLPWKPLGSWVQPWGVLLDATRLRGFSPHFQASWRVWGGDSHLPSCPARAEKRCRATTGEESHPSADSMIFWSSCHASELFLSYMDGKWMLTRFSTFSSCSGAGGYTTPDYGRSLGVRAVGGKQLLFQSNQTTDLFFLFLPCLEGLCHWVSSSLPFFLPFLKTHKSTSHVIHGTKWECRAGMSLKSPQILATLSKAANCSNSPSSQVIRV